jgi:hypothetical protein
MAVNGLSKFAWGDADNDYVHPGTVVGRRPSDGMPVIGTPGQVPNMVGEQADELPVTMSYQARMFKMWIPADVAAYVGVMDHVHAEQARCLFRREILAEQDETALPGQQMKIWMEWGQIYVLADPKGSAARGYR